MSPMSSAELRRLRNNIHAVSVALEGVLERIRRLESGWSAAVSDQEIAADHDEIEQSIIDDTISLILLMENGVVVPGDPEYDEELARCHIEQASST